MYGGVCGGGEDMALNLAELSGLILYLDWMGSQGHVGKGVGCKTRETTTTVSDEHMFLMGLGSIERPDRKRSFM